MKVSRMYTDFLNETVLTIPDKFINVKTGETQAVSPKTKEQIEFHAENNTLLHLVFSALENYLYPQAAQNTGSREIMMELLEIKRMMKQGSYSKNNSIIDISPNNARPDSSKLNLNDIEDLLEAFGG